MFLSKLNLISVFKKCKETLMIGQVQNEVLTAAESLYLFGSKSQIVFCWRSSVWAAAFAIGGRKLMWGCCGTVLRRQDEAGWHWGSTALKNR